MRIRIAAVSAATLSAVLAGVLVGTVPAPAESGLYRTGEVPVAGADEPDEGDDWPWGVVFSTG